MARPRKNPHASKQYAHTLRELGEKANLPIHTVKRLTAADGLSRGKDGLFSVGHAIQLAKLRALHDPNCSDGDASRAVYWKRRKLKADARRAELEFSVVSGLMVEKSTVRRIW